MIMKYFIYYLIFINILGIMLCLSDKIRAIKNKRRISEDFLFFIAIAGGCYGFIAGMYLFRHKTRKLKFKLLIPIICMIWLGIIVVVLR